MSIERNCKDCEGVIPFEEKALKSVMNKDSWICISCFEKRLGHKL